MDWTMMEDMYLAITRIFDGIVNFFLNLAEYFKW